jgi:ATP-dependent DNA helicase RecG
MDSLTQEYIYKFQELRFCSESEVVEFKKAESNFDIDDLGKYFSALSNEANLRNKDFAWLIFGVHDKTREVIGTSFKNSDEALNRLKNDMSQHTTDNIIFRDIAAIDIEGKRVLLFQIPAAPHNIVMKWKGIAYGRVGESLKPLDQAKQDQIRNADPESDWSAELVESATLDDLDELALATARIMFKKVHSSIPGREVDEWTTNEFLAHSEMMRSGKLTRAAILLLGKPLALQKIHPANPQISWIWKNKDGDVLDYEHFTIPYILTVDKIFGKIRNRTMRELPGGTLFPDTMKQYEDYSIREALHNCIAHQDYTLGGRITLIETDESLFYSNRGAFIPKTVERVLSEKRAQNNYRNTCLAHGMTHFNMIDTVGRGIPKMFSEQRRRFFPMPEYEIDADEKVVSVTIYGISSDDAYTDLLKSDSSLSLMECLWLDSVRRHKPITKEAAAHLRDRALIEGKSPHYVIALSVAQKTEQIGLYTKETGLKKDAMTKLVLQLASNAGPMGFKRADVFEMLNQSLPARMSKVQKQNYISNMLKSMFASGWLEKDECGKRWKITDLGAKKFDT